MHSRIRVSLSRMHTLHVSFQVMTFRYRERKQRGEEAADASRRREGESLRRMEEAAFRDQKVVSMQNDAADGAGLTWRAACSAAA